MKTSKIKTVKEVAGDGIKWRGVYYHQLEMENGDKINIGKKKLQEVGWELTYEFTGDGQKEYRDAKSVQKADTNESDEDRQTSIVRQVCIKAASEFHAQRASSVEEVLDTAEEFEKWINR